METITLNNGIKMPVAGFGVFQIQNQTQCEQCVVDVFDFTLSDEDMLAISRLDEGVTLFGKNEDPAYAKMINSVKIHGEQ